MLDPNFIERFSRFHRVFIWKGLQIFPLAGSLIFIGGYTYLGILFFCSFLLTFTSSFARYIFLKSRRARKIILFILVFSLLSMVLWVIQPEIVIVLFVGVLPWASILSFRNLSQIEQEMMIYKR